MRSSRLTSAGSPNIADTATGPRVPFSSGNRTGQRRLPRLADAQLSLRDRAHFFAIAGRAMRRELNNFTRARPGVKLLPIDGVPEKAMAESGGNRDLALAIRGRTSLVYASRQGRSAVPPAREGNRRFLPVIGRSQSGMNSYPREAERIASCGYDEGLLGRPAQAHALKARVKADQFGVQHPQVAGGVGRRHISPVG